MIFLDEPCSALDPISTGKIEEMIDELKADYTICIVTHNMQQAARVSDYTAFMYLGEILEFGPTNSIFTAPRNEQTQNYVTGRFARSKGKRPQGLEEPKARDARSQINPRSRVMETFSGTRCQFIAVHLAHSQKRNVRRQSEFTRIWLKSRENKALVGSPK